jgi:L-2,4-diaminobutyric acid acetyltransferase
VTQLIRSCEALDANSHYVQLLLCHHFSGTCLVAESDSQLVGFVSAFRPPTAPDVLFVWQVAVASAARGTGIAGRMLTELVQCAAGGDVRYLEATVTPSNVPSQKLFAGFARRHAAPLAKHCLFSADLFRDVEQHEAEDLFRIGPLPTTTSKKE